MESRVERGSQEAGIVPLALEDGLHPEPECWGRRRRGGRSWEGAREVSGVFPRSPLTQTEP